MVKGKVDILLITENVLDMTFQQASHLQKVLLNPIGLMEIEMWVGLLRTRVYLLTNIKEIYMRLNLRKNEWLIFGCYHPPFQSDKYFPII